MTETYKTYSTRWTPSDDAMVIEAAANGYGGVAKLLGRTYNAVVSRARKLGVQKARTDIWSSDRVELLIKLYFDGLSASCIAAILGGVTRNAVIGKCHRLGLAERTTVLRKKSAPRVATSAASPTYERLGRKTRGLLPIEPLPPRAETDIPRVAFSDLEPMMCRWIVNEVSEGAMCCGDTIIPGRSYCAHHLQRATPPLQKRTPSITYARPQVGYVRISHAV